MEEIKINKTIGSVVYFCSFFAFLFLVSCNSKTQKTHKKTNTEIGLETALNTKEVINANHFAFPNGKLKSVVISFDDGPEHDRILLKKLNKANIKGTFHFNSGRLGKKADWLSSELNYDVYFVNESEVNTIYYGHEVSGHGANHIGLNSLKDSIINIEVSSDLKKLNNLIKYTTHEAVQGLAYPFGAYNEKTLDVLKNLGVRYARTTTATKNFELPKGDFLELNPTCHISEALAFGSYFTNLKANKMQLLNIWGHSYEFHNHWKLADSICDLLGNKKDIWYAKTIEVVDYLNAIKNLEYTNDSVFNPSKSITVWIKNKDEKFVKLLPQKSLPIHFQSSYLKVDSLDSLYPDKSLDVKYHGDWTKIHYIQRVESFKKSPLNYGDIVFVGNSITEQGGDWSEKTGIKNIRNRGIAGDVTDGVLGRLEEIIHYKPKAIFLLIGINDLFNLHYQKQIPSPKYVAKNIIEITNKIHQKSPETKIYLQTILPTSEAYMADNINKVNTLIRDHADNSNYKLVDLYDAFVGDNSLIKPNLTSDGTHLNESGYKLWVKTIKDKL